MGVVQRSAAHLEVLLPPSQEDTEAPDVAESPLHGAASEDCHTQGVLFGTNGVTVNRRGEAGRPGVSGTDAHEVSQETSR